MADMTKIKEMLGLLESLENKKLKVVARFIGHDLNPLYTMNQARIRSLGRSEKGIVLSIEETGVEMSKKRIWELDVTDQADIAPIENRGVILYRRSELGTSHMEMTPID